MAYVERYQTLEGELRALGRGLAVPPAPPMAASVRERIERGTRPDRGGLLERLLATGRASGWRPAVTALAVVLVVLAGALAIPPVRTGLAHLLHIRGVDLQRAPHPLPSMSPSPAGPGSLRLGDRSTLAQAQAAAGFRVLVPEALGDPDQVYVLTGSYGAAVTLVYLPRPGLAETHGTGVGLLLTEVRGTVDRPLLGKLAGPDTQVTEVGVGKDPGFWLTGAPHQIAVQLGQDIHPEYLRLAGDTLVWGDGARVWRIESALDQQSAVRVAGSLR
jgi:hypothetical protein